jgi:hypothetical protein
MAAPVDGAIEYRWTGPNNFTSTSQNPIITACTPADTGDYSLTVKVSGGCVSTASTRNVQVDVPSAPCAPNNNEYTLTGLPAVGLDFLTTKSLAAE